jgi:hypothetical protein
MLAHSQALSSEGRNLRFHNRNGASKQDDNPRDADAMPIFVWRLSDDTRQRNGIWIQGNRYQYNRKSWAHEFE